MNSICMDGMTQQKEYQDVKLNKNIMEQLILFLHIYRVVFIIHFVFHGICMLDEDYKNNIKGTAFNIRSILMWTIFILSWHY